MRNKPLDTPDYARRMRNAAGIKPVTGGVLPPTPKINQVKTGGTIKPSVKPVVRTGGPAKKKPVASFNPKKVR
jgi:hypothetical protein